MSMLSFSPDASLCIKMTSEAVGTLQEEALKRRERLKNLKRKRFGDSDDSSDKQLEPDGEEKSPKPKFRSYIPQDETLKEKALPRIKPPSVEEQVKDQLEAAKPAPVIEEVDLANLAPRKPDWDLKRDVAKKLEKLDRRTQRAIAEIIRDRLKDHKEDLAEAVSAVGDKPDNFDDDDD